MGNATAKDRPASPVESSGSSILSNDLRDKRDEAESVSTEYYYCTSENYMLSYLAKESARI
jgi:hypothetical protein